MKRWAGILGLSFLSAVFEWTSLAAPVTNSLLTPAAGRHAPAEAVTSWFLKPTAAAPADATGQARLDTSKRQLTVTTTRLPPGTYSLRVVRKSDGTSWVLGLIAAPNPDRQPDQVAEDNQRRESTTHATSVLQIRTVMDLPPLLSPTDIAQVSVADHGGTILLKSAMPKTAH